MSQCTLVKQIRLDTLETLDRKKEVQVAVTYRFGDAMSLCKTYTPSVSSQKRVLSSGERRAGKSNYKRKGDAMWRRPRDRAPQETGAETR